MSEVTATHGIDVTQGAVAVGTLGRRLHGRHGGEIGRQGRRADTGLLLLGR